MRYYVKDSTLVIAGDFEAVSTGLNGGRSRVNYLFNRQVPRTFNPLDPGKYVEDAAAALQLGAKHFGLLTAVDMKNLQLIETETLSVFITAGVSNGSDFRAQNKKVGTINILLVSKEKLSETALLGAIITATEAKGLALLEKGYDFLGTNTDAVIVAYEREPEIDPNLKGPGAAKGLEPHMKMERELELSSEIPYAGSSTEFGRKITKAVLKGVKAGLTLRGE
ncbi:MAG: adenosylcobinamide amidohydrolase [Methanosarcinaceae archaeon]|nr:adenosylcobinamide amidohydrolase [Methanosarcinaceae archaeon]